jgi:excisionase family DNA binding protein
MVMELVPVGADHDPVTATEEDRPILEQVGRLLDAQHQAKLVGPDGTEIQLPAVVFRVLSNVVDHMRRGDSVSVVPVHRELTTQEAAELLGVSRPSVIRVLESGALAYRTLGTHRRIKFGDLMAYKAQRDAARQRALDELTELSQDYGLYGVARRRQVAAAT